MRLLAPIAAIAAALTIAVTGLYQGPTVAAAEGRCDVAAANAPLDSEEQDAVNRINALRMQYGLSPLMISSSLLRAARWKADDLAGGSPFGHDDGNRGWSQRLKDCGYPSSWAAENIAAGSATGAETVRQWMDSGPHRANMLSADMKVIGIARHAGGVYGWYWTADFGATGGDELTTGAGPDQG